MGEKSWSTRVTFSRLAFGCRQPSVRRLGIEFLESRCYLAGIVPAYSSLPGANHTIYLDFDGHVTQGTAWNSTWSKATINSPAFDVDRNPNSFSAQELAIIEEAWKRISEDFLPFQVNVTTVDPGVEALRRTGAADTRWGTRLVITSDTERTGAGGIAYLGSFNWSTSTPAFVYTSTAKSIAEAGSHEAGHTLGLYHDGSSAGDYYYGHGSGETSWAPIMGVGYYRNVTTWDDGTFRGATNTGASANGRRGADDLKIITTYNGFGYRADDGGNAPAQARTLLSVNNRLSSSGIIETTTDVDVFRFLAGSGQLQLTVTPFATGANLDVKAELLNSLGTVVAMSDPATTLTATINATVAKGTFYLRVSGVGTGNPNAITPTGYSDYGSLGFYSIAGTVPAGAPTAFASPPSGSNPAPIATFPPPQFTFDTQGTLPWPTNQRVPLSSISDWRLGDPAPVPAFDDLDWYQEGADLSFPLDEELVSVVASQSAGTDVPIFNILLDLAKTFHRDELRLSALSEELRELSVGTEVRDQLFALYSIEPGVALDHASTNQTDASHDEQPTGLANHSRSHRSVALALNLGKVVGAKR